MKLKSIRCTYGKVICIGMVKREQFEVAQYTSLWHLERSPENRKIDISNVNNFSDYLYETIAVEVWLLPDMDIFELRAMPCPKARLGEFECTAIGNKWMKTILCYEPGIVNLCIVEHFNHL